MMTGWWPPAAENEDGSHMVSLGDDHGDGWASGELVEFVRLTNAAGSRYDGSRVAQNGTSF